MKKPEKSREEIIKEEIGGQEEAGAEEFGTVGPDEHYEEKETKIKNTSEGSELAKEREALKRAFKESEKAEEVEKDNLDKTLEEISSEINKAIFGKDMRFDMNEYRNFWTMQKRIAGDKSIIDNYSVDGIPITDSQVNNYLREIEGSIGEVKRKEDEWEKRDEEGGEEGYEWRKQEKKRGEDLEKLLIAVLHKKLSKYFIIGRTAKKDDHHRDKGVDIVLLDKENGNTFCAIDAYCPRKREELSLQEGAFKDKKVKVEKSNQEGGASLLFGLTMAKKGRREKGKWAEERRLIPFRVKDIPAFYYAIPGEILEMGKREFSLKENKEESLEVENKICEYLIDLIRDQFKNAQGGLLYKVKTNTEHPFWESFKKMKKILSNENLTEA